MQAIEQWQSVRAGQVRIHGKTWLFQFRIAINLLSQAAGLSLRTCDRTPSFSFLCPTIIYHHGKLINYDLTMHKEKERLIQKRPGKGHLKIIKKKILPSFLRILTYTVSLKMVESSILISGLL